MTLRVRDVEVPASSLSPEDGLPEAVASALGIPRENVRGLNIVKRSLDARRKSRIVFHYQVDVDLDDEDQVLERTSSIAEKAPIVDNSQPLDSLSLADAKFRHRPVIVGSGPAGTYAALTLATGGQPAIIIDRGEAVEQRLRTVNKLRGQGELNPESNYCFGEGGAGTFSDGKLTCGRNHPLIRYVFDQWVRFGAPEDILWDAKPHIGTDFLMRIALNMRNHLIEAGTSFMFGRKMVNFRDGGKAARYIVVLDNGDEIPTDHLVLAIGHSARDTYQMLLDRGLNIVPKPFAMGVRIEHPQDQINKIQFGTCTLPRAAEYKLVSHVKDRGIWTFCMCPGGHLLPTSAEHGQLAINGMSYHSRNSGYANAAVVVNVLREDFYKGHPLDGMRFQEEVERRAFAAGGGGYISPAQRLIDFVAGRDSKGELKSTYKPGVANARLDKMLPDFITESLRTAMTDYNNKMRGYLSSDAIVAGVESKTSSPISIPRGDNLQALSHPGIFPAGEGAGFAGGIVSAALDGVRIGRALVADAIATAAIYSTLN